jgi:hypothetical protein
MQKLAETTGLVRKATTADAGAVSLINNESWKACYRGLFPQEYLNDLRTDDALIKNWETVIQSDMVYVFDISDQGVVGYVRFGAVRSFEGCWRSDNRALL